MELFDLTGKVIVVTGATSGIGQATAYRMAQHGARVVATGLTTEEAEAAAADLNRKLGADRVSGVGYELSDRAAAAALVGGAVDRFGRLDGLMGNAAFLGDPAADPCAPGSLDASFQANVTNQGLLARAAADAMAGQGGGSITFVVSTLAFFPAPSFMAYSLAKTALAHMIRILGLEFAPRNVRVNGIAPGVIRTASSRYVWENPRAFAHVNQRTPLGRMGQPDEIAGCAVFLAAPAGAYVTGQTFIVDGGQMLDGTQAAVEAAGM